MILLHKTLNGNNLNRKNKIWILILPIILISTITFSSIQKTMIDDEHSHSHHDSIIHIHQHSHSSITHSRSHSSTSISVLDYIHLSFNDKTSEFTKNEDNFEEKELYSQEVINKLLKPPRFS